MWGGCEDKAFLGDQDLSQMELEKPQCQTEFIDNESIMDESASFYGLTNVTISYSVSENDAFDEHGIER